MAVPRLVIDASVAVKWLLPEPAHEVALQMLEQYQEGRLDLVAPRLLIAEVGNVLWKRVRSGELTRDQAALGFELLLLNSPLLVDSPDVARSAFELALLHDRPFYDALYVATALGQRCDLVTADRKLFNALRAAYPFVTLLGEFPPQ